ncbi:MAG: LysM peptidoglycan-binding domain-containing protein [Muribaculaceae bacterium]|nr:LysM peptidoglycan-binding domain-containing protein [Muribaculaceae bacterium]
MVDGVNGNFKSLKLKGTNQSIDLNNLKGMQKTDSNKSIFEGRIFDTNGDGKIDENDEVIDKNGNGIIDEDEAGILQKFLNKLGGRDHKATAKDFHMNNMQNQLAFNGLNKFAEQQIAKMNGQDYVDGNTTIKPDGTRIEVIETKSGPLTTTTTPDGTVTSEITDTVTGTKTTTTTRPDGTKTVVEDNGGNKTETDYNADGKETKIVRTEDGGCVTTQKFEYEGESKTTYNYNGTAETGVLESITVENKQSAPSALGLPEGEAEVKTEYKSEEAKTNEQPESQTFTYGDKTYTVNYTYGDDGTITATIHTDGEEDRTVQLKKNEQGDIESVTTQPLAENENVNGETTQYEVKSGDNLWNIAKQQLGDGASAADIAKYVDKIMEANPSLSWDSSHTKVMIHPGDKLNLPATGKTEEATESEATENAAAEQAETNYEVKSGDNLWNIAKQQLGTDATPAKIMDYINQIMTANNLNWHDDAHTKVMIHPGQTLKLPQIGNVQNTSAVENVENVENVQNVQNVSENPEIQPVECKLPQEQKQAFDTTLSAAKDILNQYKTELGLTDEEVTYIQNAVCESIPYGAARCDKDSKAIKFNYNGWQSFDSGNFAKVMIHEITHMSINKNNSVEQERQCETRALKCALQLLEKGAIEDFSLPNKNGAPVKLSELKDEAKLTAFVEQWLTDSDYRNRLPETAE